MRILIISLLFTSVLYAGTARLPLTIPESNSDWSSQSLDQEMAPGVVIDAMFERAKDGTKIVAVSSVIREKHGDRLREFAIGIKNSFAQHGVSDLVELKRSIAGITGLAMTFRLKQGDAHIPAALFVLESDGRFYAFISFGGPSGMSALESLEQKKA